MMRISRIFSQVILVCQALAVSGEHGSVDTNLTASLENNGVDVSTLPGFERLLKNTPSKPCPIACNYLEIIFGSGKIAAKEELRYDTFRATYWTLQQSLVEPKCVFFPDKNLDISTMVLVSRLTQCPFAVKSGGHATFAEASSISNGITVSLEKLKRVSVSSDKKIASVEAGNAWHEVYNKLSKHKLAVTGGRLAGIGVGGLTLGGGFSHFVNTYGFACDNVDSYEIVIASGEIVKASQNSRPDLYWALRGGGNNFGIVTTFHMKAFTQGDLWGGIQSHNKTYFPALIDAFYNLGKNAAQDTKAAHFILFGWDNVTQPIANAWLDYSEPTPDAQILAEYKAIPALSSNFEIKSLFEHTAQMVEADGRWHTFWTATVKLDKDFTRWILEAFYTEFGGIVNNKRGIKPQIDFQIISKPQLEKTSQAGGNPLGLSPDDGPLVVLLVFHEWIYKEDSDEVKAANSRLAKKILDGAKKRGLSKDYLYMPYAGLDQAVIPSYGKENQEKLKNIAHKYDPTGVFQKLQPGHFKLDGAPHEKRSD